jgi:hypothetical protein
VLAMLLAALPLHGALPQERPGRPNRAELTPNQVSDRVDARIATLKADLRLTPEQDQNWPGVAGVLHDLGVKAAAERLNLRDERAREDRAADFVAQMRRLADYHSQRAEALRRLADAVDPFFTSLDDLQKRRFVAFLRQNEQDR